MKKVAILGAGSIARTMAQTLNGMKGEVIAYAIAARDADRAEAFRKEFGFEKAYGSYEEMLADPEVDLVYIALPHSHHHQWTLAALQAGKHVLCEKAFAANAVQAGEMIRLAEEKGLLLTEAIWTRYMPSRKMIDDLIGSGTIGRVRTVTANLGYPISHVERMKRPELAGGALLDLSVYVLNFASMVLGDGIHRLRASCVKTETGVDGQDNFFIEYEKGAKTPSGQIPEEGAMASLFTTMFGPTNRMGVIIGDKGFIEVENINNPQKITVFEQDGYGKKALKTLDVPAQITGYEYEVRAAVKAIEEGAIECPQMPHEEILEIMRQMDEARRQFKIRFPFEPDGHL